MGTDIDAPPWWTDVSSHFGALVGLGQSHPGSGLLNALDGKYHADDGNTHGGLSDWVRDHPPGPAEPKVTGVELVDESGTDGP